MKRYVCVVALALAVVASACAKGEGPLTPTPSSGGVQLTLFSMSGNTVGPGDDVAAISQTTLPVGVTIVAKTECTPQVESLQTYIYIGLPHMCAADIEKCSGSVSFVADSCHNTTPGFVVTETAAGQRFSILVRNRARITTSVGASVNTQ